MKLKNLQQLNLYNEAIPSSRDFLFQPTVSPYLVYSILKENFGEPNNISDPGGDKVQWEWVFTFNDFFVKIYDWKLLSSSIAVYHKNSNQEKSKILAVSINSFLVRGSQQKKGKVQQVIRNSKHKLLENPFMKYYSMAENLIDVYKFTDELIQKDLTTLNLDIELWNKKNDLYRSAFLMFFSAFEGFLNLLYELYLKKELRQDRLYDRISREQIDIKLRIAPIYCDGFKVKTINHEDERYKNYLRLINLRNDYIHANLLKSLERYIIAEDEYTFVISNDFKYNIPPNISDLDITHIDIVKEYIDDVINLVFESMDTKTRREFQNIIYHSEIAVEDDGGTLIPSPGFF